MLDVKACYTARPAYSTEVSVTLRWVDETPCKYETLNFGHADRDHREIDRGSCGAKLFWIAKAFECLW